MKIGEYDHAVGGELVIREMTKEEIAEQQTIKAVFEQEAAIETQKNQTRVALLNRLGITADEAKLLLS